MTPTPAPTLYQFNSQVKARGLFKADFSQDEVKNEPMFFNCDLEFAYVNGGPVTRAFITALPYDWVQQPVVFDSRVHMLMPGWYPCIPGFHHDDVPRTAKAQGQPDYDDMAYRAEHVMGLVNGQIAPTRFALVPSGTTGEQGLFEKPPLGKTVYQAWHKEVETQLLAGKLIPFEAPSGQLVQFDWQSWHEGQRALASGWRWFGRVTRNSERTTRITNEFRRQVQVYMETPMQGW